MLCIIVIALFLENPTISEPERSLSNRAEKMSDGPVQMYRSLPTYGPTGEKTLIQLNPDVKTVKQLKEKAVKELPRIPGQTEDNVRLTLDGKTLEDSSLLFECKFLPASAIHLVVKVHGG
ncbi:hypothetical protein Q5P01_002582 [Channa striata]|uniref:Ubiquitin-like domain-containing protein n=1 Tax=Channa striata TaxID=64152 RepID=A0AA88NUK5_CHASR|nr:hypothetical protein Q5P01_002582 [Channa striata]